jgi:NitT/TauT family transport system substrate-binding protein
LTLSCKPAVKTETLTFANLRLAASTLIYIAQDKHCFSDNGLVVTIKENDTGLATTDALLKGQAELGTMAEFLMVSNTLQKKPLRILGTMDKTMTMELIGLKNRGVTKASDLAGKRIGLGLGTSSEFYLGRFLEINGRNIGDVTVVNTPPAKLRDAVSSGTVDAVVAWAPYSTQIKELSPGNTVAWQVQSGQSVFGLIVGTNDWVTSHPDTVSRFWRSLAQAQGFLTRHPDEAKEILRRNVGYEMSYIDSIWPQYDFSLSLDQSLIIAMEDEARWMIKNNLTTEKQVPVFANFINENGLKAVRPEAVNIIR